MRLQRAVKASILALLLAIVACSTGSYAQGPPPKSTSPSGSSAPPGKSTSPSGGPAGPAPSPKGTSPSGEGGKAKPGQPPAPKGTSQPGRGPPPKGGGDKPVRYSSTDGTLKLVLSGKRPRFRMVMDAEDEGKNFLDVRFLGLAEHYPSGRVVPERRIQKVDEDAQMEFGVGKTKIPTADGGEAEVLDIFYALPLTSDRFKECKPRKPQDGIKATPPPVTATPAATPAATTAAATTAAATTAAATTAAATTAAATTAAATPSGRKLQQTPTAAPTPGATTAAPGTTPAGSAAPAATAPPGGTKVDDLALRKVYIHTFIFSNEANIDTSKRLECGVPYDCPTDAAQLEPACPENSTEPCIPPEASMCKVDCQQVSISNEAEATARGSIVTVGKNSVKFGVKVVGWDFCYGDDSLRMSMSINTGRPETKDGKDEADTAVIRECTADAECPPRAGPQGGQDTEPPAKPAGKKQAPMQRVNLEIGGGGEQASIDVDECAYIVTTDAAGDQTTKLDCDNVSVFARAAENVSEDDKVEGDGGKLFIGVQVPYFNTEMWWDPTMSVGPSTGATATTDDVTKVKDYTSPNAAAAALVSAGLLLASFVAVLLA